MHNVNEIRDLLQQALVAIYKSEKFEEKAMSIAQYLGLQGEKRRMRYESAKNHNLMNYLKCDSFDAYGIELKIHHQEVEMPEVMNIKGYFTTYLEKIEGQYETLHSIANKLVMANCQHYACCLYDICKHLMCDIKYYKRTIMEGDIVKWSPEFIFLHQTTNENVHDHMEEKEKEIGYDF